jgi:hypothetical protein
MWCGGKLPLICIRLIFVFFNLDVCTYVWDWLARNGNQAAGQMYYYYYAQTK